MEPSGPVSGPPPAGVRPQPSAPPPLQVGQLLQARVLENHAGRLLLTLGHRQLSTETSLPLRPGQVLTLEVRSLGERPLLRLVTALQESATAAAVRMLLPRYAPSTPLLANLPQLARPPAAAALPPALAAAARTLLRSLPDAGSLSGAAGVKAAIAASGSFLEQRLAGLPGDTPPRATAAEHDFKANLLRLLATLRGLPDDGEARRAAESTPRPPNAAAPAGSSPAGESRPPGTRPGPQQPTADNGRAAAPDTGNPPRPDTPAPRDAQRALQAATTPSAPRAATAPPPAGALPNTTGSTPGAAATAVAVNLPPPPFAGAVPLAQARAQADVDLHSLGQLRLDLLQQTEAALARIQLNQLASLPRDKDNRLVEWLFDIPVRRGDDIDLWSGRLYRDDDRDNRGKAVQQTVWRVQLAFDLPGLGPVQAQVSLQGDRVSTQFRAARETTVPVVTDNLHRLHRALTDAGLEVGKLDCRCGTLADDSAAPRTTLINEKA